MSTGGSFLDSSTGRVRQATSQRGSTLVWVMVVVLVMIIALGVGLTAVSGQFNLSSVRHEEHQAYYTALSSTETVAAWITENAVPDDKTIEAQVNEANVIEQLLEKITDAGEDGITIDEAGIPEEAGTCTVNLRWLDGWSEDPDDKNHTQLKITSVATFAGVTDTVSLTLDRVASTVHVFDGELEASDFSPDDYVSRAGELNKLTSDGVVALYETGVSNNSGFNTSDSNLLDTYIDSTTSNLEARWTNSNLIGTGSYYSNVLGAERRGSYETDWRRFMVPQNGRITIDPLENDGHEGSERVKYDDANNTRFVGLAIDNTKGKEVLFRLASGKAALGTATGNVFIKNSSSENVTIGKDAAFKIETTGTNKGNNYWSTPRYASLVTLNFTDNTTKYGPNTVTESYTINGATKTYTWHPNAWDKMDLFVQSNGQVSANLAFGPFGHKYEALLDYWSWGEFREWWRGYDAAEGTPNYGKPAGTAFHKEWPYVQTTSTKTGLPYLPVDFGRNAHFWFLDSPTYQFGVCYAWFMQGTNILEGSIYSTRATVIGGALVRSKDGYTSDGLNRALDGYVDKDPTSHATYVEATTRYSQLIYNTDIILMPPSDNNTAYSQIRRPDTWKDRDTYGLYTVPEHDKSYKPTVTIKGGTIYVGNRQHLTIQGSKSRAEDYQNGDNLWVSPEKIVVAKGGTLLIEKSYFTNILTDIYVEGGTLIIDAGAKIKGNIYAYNGGTVNVKGNFKLDAPSTLEAGQEPGGILIYGEDTIGTTFGDGEDAPAITVAGKLIVPAALPSITGNSGRVHLVGGNWSDLVTGGTNTLLSAAGGFLCDDYDSDGRCLHYTGVPSGVPNGSIPDGSTPDDGESGGGVSGGGGTTPTTPGSGDGTPGTDIGGVRSGGGWTVGTYGDS